MNKVTIHQGEEYIARDNSTIIKTILGSCVAVCLYDEINDVYGMNHFMLVKGYGENNLKYGVYAIKHLYNKLIKNKANKNYIKAKVYGGGSSGNKLSKKFRIGETNMKYAIEKLKELQIPIVEVIQERMNIEFSTKSTVVKTRIIKGE